MQELATLLQDDELNDEKDLDVQASLIHGLHEGEQPNSSPSPLQLLQSVSTLRAVSSRNSLSHEAPPTIGQILRTITSIVFTLLAAARPRYMSRNGLQPTKKEHVTSYLDALRGWAALIVVNHHYFPYGKTWIMNIPGFTILTTGRGMVDVFFVISGYVLSYRMLKLMRTQQGGPLFEAIVSSIFRRYTRLFGSAAIASLIAMSVVAFGWARETLRKPTLTAQLWDWVKDLIHFNNLFADNIQGYWYKGCLENKYLEPLWTIPVEFRGSMVVFAFCAASCKLSNRNRMLLCCFIMVCCYIWSAIYVALFLGGVLLADLSFTRHPERLPLPTHLPQSNITTKSSPQPLSLQKKIFFSAMCLSGLFLLAPPNGNLQDAFRPWPTLDNLTPSYPASGARTHFWLSIGALMLVFALDCYPTLQAPLKWNFSRYLGDLSFGIYLMHLPVIWTLVTNILNPLRAAVLGNAMWTYIPVMMVVYPAVFWAAELFIKVDDKVVAGGKWLQTRFFIW